MNRWIKFPWKIFWQYYWIQVGAYNLLFVITLGIVSVERPFGEFYFWSIVAQYFLVTLLVAAVISYYLARPIHKIVLKTWRMITKRNAMADDEVEEDLLDEEPGEYAQIENALNRIQRKMKKKRDQLQREREETQTFMSAVQEGLVSVNLEMKVVYFNSQFATQFLSSSQVNSVLSLSDIFRNPDIHEAFQGALSEGEPQRVMAKIETKLEKNIHFFSVSVNPLRKSKTREVYGAIGIFHDITELKKAEQVRIDFVGNASHELRTPLTSIKGYVETLKEDVNAGNFAQAPRFVDIIARNVDRLADLVNDLLSISTLESNAELKLEMVQPLQISEQIINELTPIVREKNQMIMVVGVKEVPAFMADARKVEQVLRNLVSNAVKYIPCGKSIQIRWEQGTHGEVVLRVKDDGPGIPEEHLPRLFERFYRIDKGRARDAGGTGLGLAIVKHIMQSHGGTVQVKSRVGEGSEFICTFPVKSNPGL